MRKSIAYRILFILIFLTVLFAVSTALSGVTNNQVQLSTKLIADSSIELEYKQIELAKSMSDITDSIQSFLVVGVQQVKKKMYKIFRVQLISAMILQVK